MELVYVVAHVNLVSVRLVIVFASEHDRCMVCAKRTIGSEIGLDMMVLLGKEVQVDDRFGLFGDSANLAERYVVCAECNIGLEIISDAPDRTPR
jgi:hypothetical protein